MPEAMAANSSHLETADFAALVKFLVSPFLEQPDKLRVDCEISSSRQRVWVRLAFDSSDKGRVFGRGGRNIQAIRTVLAAAAKVSDYTAHLEIYGSPAGSRDWEGGDHSPNSEKRPPARRNSDGRNSPRQRSRTEH